MDVSLDTWLRTGDFGDLRFGMSKDDVQRLLGPPDDEAFGGHPLADRGLHPYKAFRIADSSWGRQLERMNSVHPYRYPASFDGLTHYVLGFHDSTFECLAESFSVKVVIGPLQYLLEEIDIYLCERPD